MKISYSWLKSYIDIDLSPDEVADKLTLVGLEVDETEQLKRDFSGMVIGEVLDVGDHPSADRLQICQVNLGEETVQIICGADNVAAGQKVPVAAVGSTLVSLSGDTLEIKKIKLRGETSEGMICSEAELGLGQDHSGIMVLDENAQPGTPLNDFFSTQEEATFEIELTPNRPDATCHIGVARDLSAVLGKPLHHPYREEPEEQDSLEEWIEVSIEDVDKCHRYAGKIVRNITIKESPQWLQARLNSIGLRPINNVVDATNYILHEVGQPLHAFDYDKMEEKRIVVKSFDKEMEFQTLDGTSRKVPPETLFICDGDLPVALAGIMGGKNSEVTEKTNTIFIESAWFHPSSTRRSARQLGMQTDSSYRYERGVDPELAVKACERAAELISDLTGGEVVDGRVDVRPVRHEPLTVRMRPARCNYLLGTDLDRDNIIHTLQSLEIETTVKNEEEIECTIPSFRPDITREVDLIEEVGRIYDYNRIPKPETTPFFRPSTLDTREIFHEKARTLASRLKYKEISTNSLLSKKEASIFSSADEQIHTLNPVSSDATTLRTTLLAGFLKSLQYNLNRKARQLRFFETGHTYRRSENGTWIEGIEEHEKLMLGICGFRQLENWRQKAELYTIFDLKSDLESFFSQMGAPELIESAESDGQDRLIYQTGDQIVAVLETISPETIRNYDIDLPVFAAEVNLTLLQEAGIAGKEVEYQPVAKFPEFEYDAAYIVDRGISADVLVRKIRNAGGTILKKLNVFDVYEGGNLGNKKKSVAFRLTFLDRSKTLTINEVEPVVRNITETLEQELGAKLRS